MTPRDLIDARVGTLTVAREIAPNLFFCVCACGSSRQLTRKQITSKDVDTCVACAIRNRKNAPKKRIVYEDVPLPPVAVQVIRCVGCTTRDGWLFASPDCPKHGIAGRTGREFARKEEQWI